MALAPPTLGDVILNGKPYRILLGSYRVRDIVDFSPRAATPGGSILHSELGLYQPLMQTDWRRGFGFHWYTDAAGYMRTTGSVDTRHPGIAMMMTQSVDDTDTSVKIGFTTGSIQGTDYTFSWGASMRKRTTDGTWSDEGSYGAINYILHTQNYIFVCVNGSRIRKITKSSGTHSDTGAGANSTDYKWLHIHQGFIYAGKDGSALVYRNSAVDLATLQGDAADDPDVIVVGGGEYPTKAAITYKSMLIVTRDDGLWQITDSLIAKNLLDYSDQTSSANFRSVAVHNNKLIFPIRDTVKMWNGTTLVDITPEKVDDRFPYTTYGRFDHFVSIGRFMFLVARTNESTYNEHILCWDGTGWHKMEDAITGNTNVIDAMAYDTINDYLWYQVNAATDLTKYIAFQAQSELPNANFKTSGTHSLISSRQDMGFRWVTKSTPSVFVEAENVTANRYLTIYYSIDGGSFTEWGGSGNGKVTSDGITEKSNPLGATNSTLEYKQIQIRVDFTTDSTSQSPILEDITLRFIMRPNVLYGHTIQVVLGRDVKSGTGVLMTTPRALISQLETARASTAPITFSDPFGIDHQGYVSAIERVSLERHGEATPEGYPDIEGIATVTFVEVNTT